MNTRYLSRRVLLRGVLATSLLWLAKQAHAHPLPPLSREDHPSTWLQRSLNARRLKLPVEGTLVASVQGVSSPLVIPMTQDKPLEAFLADPALKRLGEAALKKETFALQFFVADKAHAQRNNNIPTPPPNGHHPRPSRNTPPSNESSTCVFVEERLFPKFASIQEQSCIGYVSTEDTTVQYSVGYGTQHRCVGLANYSYMRISVFDIAPQTRRAQRTIFDWWHAVCDDPPYGMFEYAHHTQSCVGHCNMRPSPELERSVLQAFQFAVRIGLIVAFSAVTLAAISRRKAMAATFSPAP